MGTKAKIAILFMIIGFVVYLVLGFLNMVPFPFVNSTEQYPGSVAASLDLNQLMDQMNVSVEMKQILLGSGVKVFGVNSVTGDVVSQWFKLRMASRGWSLITDGNESGTGWLLQYSAWRTGLMGCLVGVCDGQLVPLQTQYDVIIVVVFGPLWQFA